MAEKTKTEKKTRGPWRGEQREFLLRVTPSALTCRLLQEAHGTVKGAAAAICAEAFTPGMFASLDERLKGIIAERERAVAEAKVEGLTTEQLEEILAKRRAGGDAAADV